MPSSSARRDIVVVGGSAGGLDALSSLLSGLSADFPAAVLIVLHMGASSHLTHILSRRCVLPVMAAATGRPIERGHVYVAMPEKHLLVHDNHLLLRRGPRENLARPAIDPLFRTAAASFGGRVIGVLLSGGLSDGTAGLRAIKRCGGLAVVQEPADAAESSMPEHAIRHVEVDHVCTAAEMPGLLTRLVVQPAGSTPDIPLDIRIEAAIAVQEPNDIENVSRLGKLSPFTCPECHGALWEIEDGPMLRYRCHVGHAFSAEDAQAAQNREIQRMLESVVRANRERAALVRRMAEKERKGQNAVLAERLERRAVEYDENARVLGSLLAAADEAAVTNLTSRSNLAANGEEDGETT